MIGGAPRHPFYLLGFLVILSILSSAILHVKAAGETTTVPVTSYSSEEIASMQAQAEHHTFQAEVKQLLDILVNSLYSNKDVFLRELISNGSDALGKIRFQALTDPSALSTKHELAIYVRPDAARGILHIIDTGVGMTREDLVDNLGRIAKSGTKEFFSALQNSEDSSNLIGKFGVGFYSAFLVADIVRVTSKNNNDDQQWVWESTADGSFTVTVDPHGNTLGRGTQVSLVLKPGMSEYLDEDNLEALVHRYSEFINFPIYLWAPKDVAIEKPPQEQEEADVAEIAEDEEDAQAIEDETEYETVWGYERVNAEQPLWTRDPSTISTEQYNSFYRSLTNELSDPLTHTHFTAEGDSVKFTSVLFVPGAAPESLYTQAAPSKKPIKLFVKRVFITDDFRDVMPKYLSFVHGIVDSDDLDLNVSREVLQQTKLLDTIQRKLVRKAIGMFQELAGSDEDKYNSFWREFGTSLKWGYLEDKSNKQRLEKLMRWESTTSGLTGLEGYVERMKEGQDQIFFISGQDKNALAASPLLEKLNKRGLEVLFMTDPIDEYVTQILTRFDDFALTNIAKEGLKLGDEEEIDLDSLNDKFKPLLDFIKGALGPKRTGNVVLSQRLESVPSALVSGQWGWTANMERIVKSQALTDKSQVNMMKARRILEINPTHPIVESLLHHIESVGADAVATNSAVLLYHSALLTSGFELEDPLELSQQLQRVLTESLVIDAGEQAVETRDKDEL